MYSQARILLVDDDESNTVLLERHLLRSGWPHVRSVADPTEALPAFRTFCPDVVLLDLRMAPIDGLQVLSQIQREIPEGHYLPVLMLTGGAEAKVKQRALEAGVADFISKDVEPIELVLRLQNALRTRWLYEQIRHQNERLEQQVEARTQELRAAQREILERLALAAEFRDDETGAHTRRVGELAAQIADRLGLPSEYVKAIASAALLHDLGKIGVPDTILLKPGPLTSEEMSLLRTHTLIGEQILSGCQERVLALAKEIALTHHERWDGNGYPYGLAGEAIPLCGRIVSVADAFDAMTHDRPYRKAAPVSSAVEELRRSSGSQFDPRVVEAAAQVLSPQLEASTS